MDQGGARSVAQGGADGLIESYLQNLLAHISPLGEGEVASYIPELAKANPQHFGVAIATIDGAV